MAKSSRSKSGEPTKADSIRQVLKSDPRMKTSDVVSALKLQGVRVTPNHVYLIKSKAKGRKRRQRREAVAALASRTGMVNPLQIVARIKAIAAELGGMQQMKQLVDLLVS